MSNTSKYNAYLWPDGSWHSEPFKRSRPAKGLLAFVKRLRYMSKLYSLIQVKIHYQGNRAVAVSTNLKLVNLPEWQKKKSADRRRFSSK